MTANQLKYWQLQEDKRANRAVEAEQRRSNVAKEEETHRSNVTKEMEQERSNRATEALKSIANDIQARGVSEQETKGIFERWYRVINDYVFPDQEKGSKIFKNIIGSIF